MTLVQEMIIDDYNFHANQCGYLFIQKSVYVFNKTYYCGNTRENIKHFINLEISSEKIMYRPRFNRLATFTCNVK